MGRRHAGNSDRRPREARAPTALDVVVPIERLAAGGRGVARLPDGRVVFVPGGLPGDRVRIDSARLKKTHAEAVEVSLETPSAERRDPPCVDAERCGGCDLMALPEASQRRLKGELLREALIRQGRFSEAELPEVRVESVDDLGYRSRLRLQISDGRLGFFHAGSHDLVEVARCQVCSEALWQDVLTVRAWAARHPAALDDVEHVELRHLPGSTTGSAYFHVRRGASKGPVNKVLESLPLRATTERGVLVDELPLGKDVVARVPVGGFSQVNLAINERLVEAVLDASRGLTSFLDVYCGAGNFSLPLLSRELAGVGVESDRHAIEALRSAADAQGLPGGTFVAAPANEELARRAARGERFDLVVVDPPRAGAPGLAPDLASLTQQRLVMVSCDPVTFARDLGALRAEGFHLQTLRAFDMFPQTHHLESLAVLSAPS